MLKILWEYFKTEGSFIIHPKLNCNDKNYVVLWTLSWMSIESSKFRV